MEEDEDGGKEVEELEENDQISSCVSENLFSWPRDAVCFAMVYTQIHDCFGTHKKQKIEER